MISNIAVFTNDYSPARKLNYVNLMIIISFTNNYGLYRVQDDKIIEILIDNQSLWIVLKCNSEFYNSHPVLYIRWIDAHIMQYFFYFIRFFFILNTFASLKMFLWHPP